MDVAYDHIQEEALPSEEGSEQGGAKGPGLNEEFQEAFKAVSSSPWGARLGGFFGQLKTQGESLYNEASKEYSHASEQASKGLSGLRDNLTERAKNISFPQGAGEGSAMSLSDPTVTVSADETTDKGKAPAEATEKPESLPADIVKEATSMVNRFKLEAASRLATVRKAEDAADEALLRFGTNIRNFLREAVVVSSPDSDDKDKTEVLFETNDAEGRRVFHSTRFDAQLHAIHTRIESFTKDPEGSEWDKWKAEFDVGKETDRIAADLEKYEELRRAMEKLVPEKVEYKDFWVRYYFMRMIVEEEERRRKEVLKGAAAGDSEEVAWGSDEEEEEEEETATTPITATKASQSTTTLVPPTPEPAAAPSRRSHDEKSTSADSDASYDLVSGANSKTPGTPLRETEKEDSDDEDWE